MQLTYYSKEFPFFRRIVARVSRVMDFTYTSRRGVAKGLKRRGGLGFIPSTSPSAEEAFLWSLDLSGKTVFDVGGFEGLMTIYFASQAGRVITYEPIAATRRKLLANIGLNGFQNVTVRDCALASAPGELRLTINDLMSGGASGDPEIAREFHQSDVPLREEVVPVTTIDIEVANGQPAPDFVKVDVEGMEGEVLAGMKGVVASRHPWLYFELHGTTPDDKRHNATQVIGTLLATGYRVFDVEANRYIPPGHQITGIESHVFAHPEGARPFKR